MLGVHHAAQHCPTIKIILTLVYFVFALKAKKQTAEQTMVCSLFPGSIIIKYLYINRKLCVCEINLEIYIAHNISYPGFKPRVALELAGGDNRCKTEWCCGKNERLILSINSSGSTEQLKDCEGNPGVYT